MSNFAQDDQAAARLILDSIEIVGQDELRTSLQRLLTEVATEVETPIALVPVRPLAEGQSYYSGNRNAKARLLLQNSFPGSEAIIANIASGQRRELENAGPFVASPSLSNLRRARCRTILFVDDFSGSGDRAISFHRGFRKHSTLYSWESYGLISYRFAAYSITSVAHKRLRRNFGADYIHSVRTCPTFETQSWTSDEMHEVEDLCLRYVSSELSPVALGYGGSRALMAFSHSVPNNLPAILFQKTGPKSNEWYPFFEGQSFTGDLNALIGSPSHDKRLENSLRRLGQVRLAGGGWRSLASPDLVD